jgi:hypothetical protein
VSKVPFFAAPALMAMYGVVRLLDGRRGPGFGWTFGHLLMLAGLVLFAWVIAGLRRQLPRGGVANVITAITAVGLCAGIVQIGIDVVVGLVAGDAAAKSHDYERIQAVPGVTPVVYAVVPVFFYVGFFALVAMAAIARPRLAPWWTPVLALAGTVAVASNLDFLPEAGIADLIALAPIACRGPVRPPPRHSMSSSSDMLSR